MAVTISPVLRRIKSDLAEFLPDAVVRDACRQVGHVWRRRRLDPVLTLHLFILQVLHFNTALTHLRHLSKVPMTAAGYCKARMRLPLAALQVAAAAIVGGHATRPGGWTRPVVRAARLPGGRLQHDHARHAGVGQVLRPPQRPEDGLLVSRPQAAGALRRLHRPDRRGALLPAVHPRDEPGVAGAPAAGAGRPAGGRPRLLLLRPPGIAAPAGHPRLLPHAPAADRQLPRQPQEASQGAQGQAAQHVPRAAGQAGPTRAVAQAAPGTRSPSGSAWNSTSRCRRR